MSLLSLSNVKKYFGATMLFSGISFTIEDNHKVGLVGVNGSGKTTLFKIIQDKLDYDSGEIFKSKNTVVGYVEQFICEDDRTVYEEALEAFRYLIDIENKIHELQKDIELRSWKTRSEDKFKKFFGRKVFSRGRIYF